MSDLNHPPDLTHTKQAERMRDWFGLHPTTRRACPITVTGKRCKWFDCMCPQYRGTGIMDHSRSWLTRDKFKVFTSEPYGVAATELAKFTRDCAGLELDVAISHLSPWNPGSTTLVIVTQGWDELRFDQSVWIQP